MQTAFTWRDFSTYLRQVRLQKGLTQEALALQLGCTALHVSRLEHGKRRPSKVMLRLLLDKYILEPDQVALICACEKMIDYGCEDICAELTAAINGRLQPISECE